MQDKVLETIDEELKQLISFEAEVETFKTSVSLALQVLVKSVENRLENIIITMTKRSWFITTVGDQSDHITQIGKILAEIVPKIRQDIDQKYFRSFCDKFCE